MPSDVANVIVSLYASLGDRPAFDAHLDPGVTIWESDAPRLMRGLTALDELRDARAAGRSGGPAVLSVVPEVMSVDVWDDTALTCSLLWVTLEGEEAPTVHRMTDVLRRTDRWRIVHHHAELERA
ncbi:nuclear transport factor 2 family protein [Phytoactinopolyspora alkaliphila]|uniref:Nuclear transport factor 2 family protein n=2 Tax=Phytoactinopolyspora alkaliphila TaxID=1783498 RepID=A0A6N9YPY3_9ACTN|nr:nuclear transport factor 2 family protein [Phytoactinopolyspora alkaliphila]